MFRVPEQYRITSGKAGTSQDDGNNGAFRVPIRRGGRVRYRLFVVATDGSGWEHVSVSHHLQMPSWLDMSAVQRLFWSPEDTVMQLHVPVAEHINLHPHCLHLWRPVGVEIPRPPNLLVGPAPAPRNVAARNPQRIHTSPERPQ